MNEKMARILRGREDQYPCHLQQQYPRILNNIGELWGEPELDTYFETLFIDQRGKSEGFPPEVMTEIIRLNSLHKTREQRKIDQPSDPWTYVWAAKRMEEWESNACCRMYMGRSTQSQLVVDTQKLGRIRSWRCDRLFTVLRALLGLRS